MAATPVTTSPPRALSAVREGVATMLPLTAAYVPFGLVVGAAVAAHGSVLAGWAGSWLIFGGTAHLATLRTLDQGGLAAAVLTGLLVNARLVAYGASLARLWTDQPRWFRFAAAGLVIDPTWAVAEHFERSGPDARRQRQHFLAAGLTLGIGWSCAIGAGAALGSRLDWLDLEIVVPLCLLAMVGPSLRDRDSRAVVVAAAVVAYLARNWPSGTGTLAAIAVGCLASWPVRGRHGRRRRQPPAPTAAST